MIHLITLFKPFIILWATLNVIDDLSLVMKLFRLSSVFVPILKHSGPDLCSVCDDVISDLLKSDGLSLIPCKAACLGIPACISMCENIQTISQKSTEFPCIAAGYCDPIDSGVMTSSDQTCTAGPLFSCLPRQICRRRRKGRRGVLFRCELKPGVGRWVGLKRSASDNVAALAEGLINQKYCGDRGAGPFCKARPKAWGLVAEVVGSLLALFVGGYHSVMAIESVGGDDDRMWLTFWFILAVLLFVEKVLARVILSTFPLYFEAKLVLMIWLLFSGGSEATYRKIRKVLIRLTVIKSEEETAKTEMSFLRASISNAKVKDELNEFLQNNEPDDDVTNGDTNNDSITTTQQDWEHDPDFNVSSNGNVTQLYRASQFILGREDISDTRREHAASVVSFNPRYVRVHLHGSAPGDRGDLPLAPSNMKKVDAYVTCRVINDGGDDEQNFKRIRSKICYQTSRPSWNQHLELPLSGKIGPNGFFRNSNLRYTSLHLDVRDFNVGKWGVVYNYFRVAAICCVLVFINSWLDGTSDNLSSLKLWLVLGVIGVVVVGLGISYVMAVVRRGDDVVIGECEVPLNLLLDQDEHVLLLTLRSIDSGDDDVKGGGWTTRNSVGGMGMIRVSLLASEN